MRKLQVLSRNTQIQVQGLYSFPTVEAVGLYLVTEAVKRHADYIEVCLEDRDKINLEVRDNGIPEGMEALAKSEEMKMLAGLGTVQVTTCSDKHVPASLISLHPALTIRPTTRLRKPGQIVSISSLFSSFPPREKEYLSSDSHTANLNLTALRAVLIHFDVKIIVQIMGKIVLNIEKMTNLMERFLHVLGGNVQLIDYKKDGIEIKGAISELNNHKKQFLYLENRPITCPAITDLINSHIQTALMGKSNRNNQIYLIYALNLRFEKMKSGQIEGGCVFLMLENDEIAIFEEIFHIIMKEKLGIAVKCDGNPAKSLKRKQPARLIEPKKHTFHHNMSDTELVQALDQGETAEEHIKRPKLMKNAVEKRRWELGLVASLVEEACTDVSKPVFSLPASLQSFTKFPSCPNPPHFLETHQSFTLKVSSFSSISSYLGQFDDKCLLVSLHQNGYLLLIGIDQHAAHERVNLECFERNWRENVGSVGVNEELEVSVSDLERVKAGENELKRWGFEYYLMEETGKIRVKKVPEVCGKGLDPGSILTIASDYRLQASALPIHR